MGSVGCNEPGAGDTERTRNVLAAGAQKAEKNETIRYFSLCSLFLFATGKMALCLVGVHAVFSVLALTFNQYGLIL